jgi:hypothetical protein
VALIATGALAVAAAACGGSSAASTTLDSATLAARGDAVCTAFNHQANVSSHQIAKSPRAGFTALVAAYDREVGALHALHPSATDQPRFGRMLGMISKERPIFLAFEKHTIAKDSGAVRADAGHAFTLAAQVSGIAVGLSMTQCALSVDTTTPPTSPADYHQTIASECYAATAAIQQLPKPAQTSDLATYAKQADPLFDQELRDVLAQPKPSGVGVASIQPWIDTQQLAKQYLDAVGKAAAINDVSTLQNSLAQLKAETAHAHSAALAADIPGCAG